MSVVDPQVPDTETRGLVAALPAGVRPYWLLARFDRPIGAWLLYWPGAWAIALAGGAVRRWDLLAWFALGALAMRGAGCVYNDIVDRELDRKVARTAARPLASGRVTVRAAWAWLALLCAVGAGVLIAIGDPRVALVAVASVAPVAAYPYMKRITWWPQAWLGLVFSWAALVGWCAAAQDAIGAGPLLLLLPTLAPGLWLYAGSVCWVIGYDTIYALQDIEDDALAGVRSSARALGRHARAGIAVCYAFALLLWSVALWDVRPQRGALLALVPVALQLAWQVAGLRIADPADALARFRANRTAGLLMFVGCLVVGQAG